MVPVVSFIGKSESGKTTLLTRVVRELKRKGVRVGVIKHAHHGFEIDRPGKDSWRLAEAGSDVVVVSSPGQLAMIERVDDERTVAQITALFGNRVDIVLTEGYKSNHAPVVVVRRKGQNDDWVDGGLEVLALVESCTSSEGTAEFDESVIERIVGLVAGQCATEMLRGRREEVVACVISS